VSRIAAGEVVERPAAVVKELIDNSLDAGSTRITIEVTDGGRRMIKVTDDGEGMGQADALLAFQRHATSKLRSEEDLLGIRTLGFRGEALPSIASVSKVRMVTACRHEPVGTRMLVTGGTITKTEEAAAAPGTQIEVTDLFFNTPARRKFLKATTTEFSHLCQIVQQAALAWPRTQFRLRHNGQDVLEYSLVSSLRDRVLQIYGARFLKDIIHQPGRQVIRGAFRVRSEELGMPIPGDSRGEWPRPGSTAAGEPPHDSMRPAEQQTMAHDTGRDDRPTAMAAGEPTQTYLIGPGCEVIPMGQIGRTFLVAQVGSELHVIDQHTAHERVLYERLWRAWQARGVQSQP